MGSGESRFGVDRPRVGVLTPPVSRFDGLGIPTDEGGKILPTVRDAQGRAQRAKTGALAAGPVGATDLGVSGPGFLLMEEEDVVEGPESRHVGPVPGLGMCAAEMQDLG